MKNKIKKNIKFYKQFEDSIIGKGMMEEAKRLERKYERHRARSAKTQSRNV